ncbi:MAG TPA: peptidylprolyl isomerase [Gammaproteobacteria bacterium]|nr:peptidylprolyl isomerase [Gammaproteobacteria bacterium]
MLKLLKDPLLHFLLIGACLFAIAGLRGQGRAPNRIVITADQVQKLRASAELVKGRPLTREELTALIEPTIQDEVLYREALALGLDVDDDEVHRRLVDKMRYLSEDLADPEPPSEQTLRDFYASSPQRFEIPERVTFDQVFFSPDVRGESIDSAAAAALAALEAGADPEGLGDKTPLQRRFTHAPADQIRVLFGAALTDAVFKMAPDKWAGPFRSDFGLHLVRVVAHAPARLPPFEEIRDEVAKIYGDVKRAERNAAEYAKLRAKYDVVIEWPAEGQGS